MSNYNDAKFTSRGAVVQEKKHKILNLLQDGHEMFTAEIAKSVGLSSATTSKYLQILKAEHKVTNYHRAPYVYWKKARGHARRR